MAPWPTHYSFTRRRPGLPSSTALNPASAYGDIQATIWQLFDQYAPAPSSNYWLSQAQANYSTGNYSNFFVVTNVGPGNPTGQVQEFLTELNPSMSIYPAYDPTAELATPEPELMGAMGLALIGLGIWIRFWRNRQKGGQKTAPHTE